MPPKKIIAIVSPEEAAAAASAKAAAAAAAPAAKTADAEPVKALADGVRLCDVCLRTETIVSVLVKEASMSSAYASLPLTVFA